MRLMKNSLGVIVMLWMLLSCSGGDPVPLDIGLDFFPLQVGMYRTYRVEQTTYQSSQATRVMYDLRVTITDSFPNPDGSYTYTLVHERRSNETAPWVSTATWSAKLVGNQLVQNESNVLFVKLLFPVAGSLEWDANQYNDLPNHGNYFPSDTRNVSELTDIDEPIDLGDLRFEKTATVVQNDLDDAITGRDLRYEVYVKGVGLVYKETDQVEYCTNQPSCLGQRQIVRGLIYKQQLMEYGPQ